MTTRDEPKLLNFDSVEIVYQVTNNIIVKRTFADDNKGIYKEYRIYDILDSMPYCPNLVQSFYRILSTNFLQYFSDDTLEQQLRQYQIRDSTNDRVIEVKCYETQSLI